MTKYITISADQIPAGVRFDVTRSRQGQTVEVAYGGWGRSEHDEGDEFKRVIDRTDGVARYYRRVD